MRPTREGFCAGMANTNRTVTIGARITSRITKIILALLKFPRSLADLFQRACYNEAFKQPFEEFPMDDKERARALETAFGQIEKQFGKGSILRLGSKDAIVPVLVI